MPRPVSYTHLIVLVCMLVMNRFGEGEEQAVKL